MRGHARRIALIFAGSAMLGGALPVYAETLREALSASYKTNPTLQSARANQRATDETVPIAKASGLPSLQASAAFTEFLKQSSDSQYTPKRSISGSASLSVPIYSGGAVRNSVKAAETRVNAGQAELRGVEAGLFSQVVSAYMDVLLNESLLELHTNNTRVLAVNLEATQDRFEIGDLTRTDVAQSESRLALARGDLRSAEANLIASRERYLELVGHAPRNLQAPPPLVGIPERADETVAIALESNPDLLAAREKVIAAGYDVEVAGAGRLPTISLYSNADHTDFLNTMGSPVGFPTAQRQTSAQVGVRATIPIFQGGLPAARRRQAQALESATLEREIGVEREVIAVVRSAFSSWRAANALIQSTQAAVDAARLSLEGVRAENTVGNRTILDILDAEQEFLFAQVQHATARRNAYVAGFSLLAAMGKAEARDLGLEGGLLYDPELNYRRVRGKFFDWDTDPDPQPISTRTVDMPAQDSSGSLR